MSANRMTTVTEPAWLRSPERQDTDAWPPIALVTPVFNSAHYVEHTIRSVLDQGYPNLKYFIIDGGSTDGTLDIIRKYENRISGWVSEPDRGMYDALNKGFAQSSSEIMGWISATDVLQSRGLFVVGSVFRTFPSVEWITGVPTVVDETGMTVEVQRLPHWSRTRVLLGANRHIQQESTFWRRSLWERAGGQIDDSHGLAGDFDLWMRFFRHARLHPVNGLIGAWRLHEDSLGWSNVTGYNKFIDDNVESELAHVRGGLLIRAFRRFGDVMMRTPGFRRFWRDGVMRALYRFPGPDWAPTIIFEPRRGWVMKE
jgi:glycosyltransferase involved in cell wall biosynthesis